MKKVFDIGYNVGEFSEACLSKFPDCEIISVEANPYLIPQIGPDNIKVLNYVCSDKDDKEVDFYIEDKQSGISTASLDFIQKSRFTKGNKYLPTGSASWNKPIKVKSITLDRLIKDHGIPDLIKIDVEGYEYAVIKGLTSKANMLCFEWHEEDFDSIIKIADHLESLDYKNYGVIGYFEESVPPTITHSEQGDPYMEIPVSFHSKSELMGSLEKVADPERRVHYGMLYVI